MMMERLSSNKFGKESVGVILLILIAALGRILLVGYNLQPFPNFEVITLVTFLGVFLFRSKIALIIPIMSILISDLVLGNTVFINPLNKIIIFTYSGFLMVALVSRFSVNRFNKYLSSVTPRGVMVITLIGLTLSLVYDVWTNFGWWYLFYPHTPEAFTVVFTAGIPFMIYHLLSNVFLLLVVALPVTTYITSINLESSVKHSPLST